MCVVIALTLKRNLIDNFSGMHNIWVRLNAVIFFGLTVLLVLATFCAFRFD